MKATDRAQLLLRMRHRRDTIAESWYQAIASTSYSPSTAAEVRQHLADLTGRAIEALVADPFEPDKAKAIGASLAGLHYLQPEALGRTQEVLGRQLFDGLSEKQVAGLQPRLVSLLSGVGAGFLDRACRIVLSEQEQVRRALTTELRGAQEALQKAYDEVERRVQERTAELAAANEQLRCEILERSRVEETLQKSDETVRALLNAPTDDVVVLVDADGVVLEANEALARRFGKDIDEVVGLYGWDLVPADLAERRRAYVDEVIQSGAPVRFEDERAGTCFDNIVYPVLDAQGKVTRVAVLARDITERKRMEERLRRSLEETARGQRLLLALSEATQTVQSAHTPEAVYRAIGDGITGLGYNAVILTLTGDATHLTTAYMPLDSDSVQSAERLIGIPVENYRFPLAPDGSFQRMIAERRAVFIEPVVEYVAEALPVHVRPQAGQVTSLLGIEQAVCAPLTSGSETHGLLAVIGSELTETDTQAVSAFAGQAAIALSNARLYQEARTWAAELEGRVAERTKALTATTTELEAENAERKRVEEKLRQLTQQLVSAQEEERTRLSRALHDEAGQALTALKISLELMERDLPDESKMLRPGIADAVTLTDATMRRVRLLAQDLRPPALDAVGLNATLEGFCRDFGARTQIPIEYHGVDLPPLPESVNICLYRFLQEALTNVARHAGARQVHTVLRHDAETVSLSVVDDGRGFDQQLRRSTLDRSVGIGLLGMEERLTSLGGWLDIESEPGQGTRLVAHVPMQEESFETGAGDPHSPR